MKTGIFDIKKLSFVLLGIAGLIFLYSAWFFPIDKVDLKLFVLAAITILWGSTTQLQLPRTKIHFSIAESFIFFVLLVYGIETAVLLSAVETLYASYFLRRRNVNIKTQTIFLNASITTVSTFGAGMCLRYFSHTFQLATNDYDIQYLFISLFILSAAHFLINSVLVAFFTSLKTDKTFWQIWNKNCLSALIMYLIGAFVTAIMIKAVSTINPILILAGIVFAAITYLTYRRYVEDIKETSTKAEQAERLRAEQAENHVVELQHYITEIESSSKALKESEKKLRYTAFHDSLTDLPNRNKFLERLDFLIQKTKYSPELKFAVLNVNLNRFKAINDSLGHQTGNLLLQNVAKRIQNLIGKEDLAARFGSDEFAVILMNLDRSDDAVNFAEKMRQKISEPYTLEGRQVFASACIGIAENAERYTKAENLIRDANIAMYHAKEAGISWAIFDQKMHTQAVTRLQIEMDLRHAIERDELVVYYQPIIDLNTIQLMGFEALMRWQHPQRGLVPPNEFIPVSETTGLIIPMTLWILRESCRNLVEWQRKYPGNNDLVMSVNLSGKHFTEKSLVEQVEQIIYETGINVNCLKLEITESAVMENAESAIKMLKQLRDLGVKLSIDDFGTGYSSLSYLHRFPINTLKVDRSFVCSMEAGSENGEIVRTIIALAKALKLSVIAEGIESIHQLHQLRILGCEYGQGYLFSRPVPKDEAVKLLKNSSQWEAIMPHPQNRTVPQPTNFPLVELEETLAEPRDLIQ